MAWMTKSRLKDEIVQLTYRVAELEERLCPAEQHNWVKAGHRYTDICGHLETVHRYKCRRCGKVKEDIV